MSDNLPSEEQCCNAWSKAQQPGTDNEMYGQLLRNYGGASNDWHIGCDLPPVKFCPWCGAKKHDQ